MLWNNVSISALADLCAELEFECTECGARALAPIDRVGRRFGDSTTLARVRALAVCPHCDSIEVRVRPLVHGPSAAA